MMTLVVVCKLFAFMFVGKGIDRCLQFILHSYFVEKELVVVCNSFCIHVSWKRNWSLYGIYFANRNNFVVGRNKCGVFVLVVIPIGPSHVRMRFLTA